MCNFDNKDRQTKEFLHLFFKKASQNIEGVNYLLTLIETIRSKKPHPLMEKKCQIASNNTIIRWNKVIFKDKIVTPQNPNDGKGFRFRVFETIEDDVIIFNPVFIAFFFCSSEFTKKALN